jgi:threonine dehydratase
MPTASLVSLDDIRAAQARLEGVARRTPVLPISSHAGWQHLLVKCENLQTTGAFKLRGAYNLIAQIDPVVRARGVVTYSSGNHGQAVAWAAARFSIPAVVVMPTTAPAVKIDGTRSYGAEVQFAGTTSLDRMGAAETLARERGMTMVPPFDDARIIAGQGTVGLELLEQVPAVTAVYVPMGGGGQASGVAVAVKSSMPNVRLVGVEPVGAPKMTESLAAGHPITLTKANSIADGLLAVRPGDLTFEHVRALIDEVVRVTEDEIADALRFVARHTKMVVEPSGATSVAGAQRLAPPGSAGVHVAILSGGNVEPNVFAELLGVRRW